MGRDNTGFQRAVEQESVHYVASGRDAAVFCHQYFAEPSINR